MSRKRNRQRAPKSQEQVDRIVDQLKLSDNERIKLLCWIPRALQSYDNLKLEQVNHLTVRQRLGSWMRCGLVRKPSSTCWVIWAPAR
jgi:hypothetical protein